MFKKSKKLEEKPRSNYKDKYEKLKDDIKSLEEKKNELKATLKEYREAHEKMKAMKAKKFLEKYVTKLVITDLRDGETIIDTGDGVITIDKYSENNWLSCSDTELIVNFKKGYELTLRIEKEGDC